MEARESTTSAIGLRFSRPVRTYASGPTATECRPQRTGSSCGGIGTHRSRPPLGVETVPWYRGASQQSVCALGFLGLGQRDAAHELAHVARWVFAECSVADRKVPDAAQAPYWKILARRAIASRPAARSRAVSVSGTDGKLGMGRL